MIIVYLSSKPIGGKSQVAVTSSSYSLQSLLTGYTYTFFKLLRKANKTRPAILLSGYQIYLISFCVAVISFYLAFHYFVFGPLSSIKIETYIRSFEKEIMLRYG
jgi:hypothetical protein